MRQSRMVGTARRAVRRWFLPGTVASARRPYLRQPAVTDALRKNHLPQSATTWRGCRSQAAARGAAADARPSKPF